MTGGHGSRGAGPGRRTIPNLLGEAALTTPHVAGIQANRSR